MYGKFTNKSRNAVARANIIAQRFNHDSIRPEHILLGLLRERSFGVTVLTNLGIDLSKLGTGIEKKLVQGKEIISQRPPRSHETETLFQRAMSYSTQLGHNYVGTEHLFHGLLDSEEIAAEALRECGLTKAAYEAEVLKGSYKN